MRHLKRVLFAVVAAVITTASAHAREPVHGPQTAGPTPIATSGIVEMPFACGYKHGRLFVTPERIPKTYPVVKGRAQRPFTHCLGDARKGCATIMVHSFDIVCSGERVPWMRVVASAHAGRGGRAWLEDGKLHIRRTMRGKEVGVAVLPPGFAPLGHLSARLDVDDEPDAPVRGIAKLGAQPERRSAAVPHPVRAATTTIRAAAHVTVEKLPSIDRAPGPPNPDAEQSGVADHRGEVESAWATVVSVSSSTAKPASIPAPVLSASGPNAMFLTWGALTALLGASAWFAIRMRPQISNAIASRFSLSQLAAPIAWWTGATNRIASTWSAARAKFDRPQRAAEGPGDENLSNGISAVETLCESTRDAIAAVAGAPSLREVLNQELSVIRGRLVVIKHTQSDDTRAPRRASQTLRVMVRDLERIGRIANSAAKSMVAGGSEIIMPRTRNEAYEVLGINAGVSENVLKKVVDALRMSWHPDLAKDDADRTVREDRIKQINIAWELINGKRSTA